MMVALYDDWYMLLVQFACICGGVVYFVIFAGVSGTSISGKLTSAAAEKLPMPTGEMSQMVANAQIDGSAPRYTPRTAEITQKQRASCGRMAYLDNIKVFLTHAVIVHHVTCLFSGGGFYPPHFIRLPPDVFRSCTDPTPSHTHPDGALSPACLKAADGDFFVWGFAAYVLEMNQAYFMAMFFFISGFFCPVSLDRRGRRLFIQDRFRRLGLASVVWFMVLGPLLVNADVWFLTRIATPLYPTVSHGADYTVQWWYGQGGTWITTGPQWFVAWLLTLSVCYAFMDGEPLSVSLPSAGTFMVIGASIGLLQAIVPWHDFMGVPGGFNMLVLYLPFFGGGILANRNNWLECLAKLPRNDVWFVRGVTVALLAVFWRGGALAHQNGHYLDTQAVDRTVLKGVYAVCMSLFQIEFFQRHVNSKGRLWQLQSEAAYAAYLIHPWVVVPVAWSYHYLLKVASSPDLQPLAFYISYPPRGVSFFSACGILLPSNNEACLWLAWGYVSMVSTLVLWPLAYGIKQLPGANRVL